MTYIPPQLLSEVRYLSIPELIELDLVIESKEGEESSNPKSAFKFEGKIKNVDKAILSLKIYGIITITNSSIYLSILNS